MALTDTAVKNAKPKSDKPAGYKMTDGQGMHLLVKASGKYWRMEYRYAGKRNTAALGTYPAVSLAKARQLRDKAKEQLADGIDPNVVKRQEKRDKTKAVANSFEMVAREWLEKTATKRKPNTQQKVTSWLEKNVIPYIGKMPISEIKSIDVLKVLRKMEERGVFDSAHRVKQVIGQIFRYATVLEITDGDVTHALSEALAKPIRGHHAAITEPEKLIGLLRSIHAYKGHPHTQIAFKLLPMLLVRPGELRHMEWSEINLEAAEWRIPGSKMKMGADHIVPLSTQALSLLKEIQSKTGHGMYVFPGIPSSEKPLSENTFSKALRSLGYDKDTQSAHGFRATARTILDQNLGVRIDHIEHQLAHAVKDPTGRAYNRTTHLPARREMMQQWADYLDELRVEATAIQPKNA